MELSELLKKITPLPWKAFPLWDASGIVANKIDQDCQPGRKFKSDTTEICRFPPDTKINRPNAAYITHAANVLPELVEALTAVDTLVGGLNGWPDWKGIPVGDLVKKALARAEEVKE